MGLLGWVRERRERSRRDAIAIQRSLRRFAAGPQRSAAGATIVRRDTDYVIVRVMYVTDRIPPERVWYLVPDDGAELRELSRDEAGDTAVWR